MKKQLAAIALASAMTLSLVPVSAEETFTQGELTDENITLTFSWWGGESRHAATQEAIEKWNEIHPNIQVEGTYGEWSGWEAKQSQNLAAGTGADIMQVNWNWLSQFSGDGSKFLDLNSVSDYLDLSQWDDSIKDQCVVADSLQAVPVSMTGRIFFWNKATFDAVGVDVPSSFAELEAAGEAFADYEDGSYYPLALGEYDRMILMVFYLESVYDKAWVVDNELNFTEEEITEGVEWIQSLEEKHIIPSMQTIDGDGADALNTNAKWIDGHYAGIFEWDSSATKYRDNLDENGEFVVGDEFEDFGGENAKGGYAKVSLGFAITSTTQYPNECAAFINFLLNEEEGVSILTTQRGIPASAYAFSYLSENDLMDADVSAANEKVLAHVSFPLDPNFESSKLKGSDGYYVDAFAGLSYGDYSVEEAVEVLVDGINEVYGDAAK